MLPIPTNRNTISSVSLCVCLHLHHPCVSLSLFLSFYFQPFLVFLFVFGFSFASLLDETKVKEPRDPSKASDIKISPGTNVDYQILGGSLEGPRPVVTICVESPRESPDSPQDRPHSQPPQQPPPPLPQDTVIDMVDPEPIDVNLPRDTSNIFYDYEEPKEDVKPPEVPPRAHQHPIQADLDKIEYDEIQRMSSSTSSATSSASTNSSSSSSDPAVAEEDQCQCPPTTEETLRRSS